MVKEKKKLSNKAKLTICIVCALIVAILIPLIVWVAPVKGSVSTDHWCSAMEYTEDYAISLEKKPNEDFRILAISDPQLSDIVGVFDDGDPLDEIDQLLKKEPKKPDLIIIMGDITWTAVTKLSVKKFVKYMDSLGILWAPILGNHEDEKEQGYYCSVDRNWVADELLKSKTCLFKKGPNNIGGVGNYVINIKENGKIRETLVFMDTHAKRIYPEFNNEWLYDYIYDSQIDWYKWVIKGVTKQNNNVMPESMLYIHIPLPEYETAYAEYKNSTNKEAYGFFGNYHEEKVWCGAINSGMFDVLKDIGSTKYVFAGHDHKNNYSLLYQGIRLTYTTKTGKRCDYYNGQTGGTVITIGDEGTKANIEHKYIKY